jgi:hypothetical protein
MDGGGGKSGSFSVKKSPLDLVRSDGAFKKQCVARLGCDFELQLAVFHIGSPEQRALRPTIGLLVQDIEVSEGVEQNQPASARVTADGTAADIGINCDCNLGRLRSGRDRRNPRHHGQNRQRKKAAPAADYRRHGHGCIDFTCLEKFST